MAFWIVVNYKNIHRGLMGPYHSQLKADSINDDLGISGTKVYETESGNRTEAAREIREQRMREIGPEEGFKNFKHKGVREYVEQT